MNVNQFDNRDCGCMMPPVYECPQERVCTKVFMNEVPHIIPVHTKYVNHHIFKHTYTPAFTEETIETSENITTPSCGGNMYM